MPSSPPAIAGDHWPARVRHAWRTPERIDLPAWSEKYRWLSRRQTTKDRVGFWRNHRSPALIGFMRLLERPGLREITVLKHSQGGWSEAVRNFIGKKAHLEPDPFLFVLPDKDTGKGIIQHRIIPLFSDTPVLQELKTGRRWDEKTTEILLANGFVLRLGFSGSIASVAAHPARFVLNDERSKFQDNGKVSIADSIEARTSQYEDSLVINLSTPGQSDPDPTDALFQSAVVKLYYFVRCPHCGREQRLTFDALEWSPKKADEPDKNRRAATVVANRSAWLKCQNPRCGEDHPAGGGRISETDRQRILIDGCWATEDFSFRLWNDGREEGTWPAGGTRVGLHAPAFTSLAPKHRTYAIAERFIRAEGDIKALVGVYNELFAEVYRQATHVMTTSIFERKCRPDPETGFTPPRAKLLPAWAARLVMTVDTQKDHFWFVIRAYGASGRSRRIHHGKVMSFEELSALADEAYFPYEDNLFPPRRVFMTGIDSGGGKMGLDHSRTDQVYRWCLLDRARRKPIKGESEPKGNQPIRWSRVSYTPPEGAGRRDPYQVVLWLINSHYFQDLLASDSEAKVSVVDYRTGEITGEVDRWELNEVDDEEYNRHLANMKKALVSGRGKSSERWIPKTQGARVDLRMCEVYQEAMANGPAECQALPTTEAMRRAASAPHSPPVSGGIRTPDGRSFLANRRQ